VRQATKSIGRHYVHTLPQSVSFTGKGLLGYSFWPLRQDLEVYYIESEKGHDTFMVSKKITRTYYVISGTGYFTIDRCRYDVRPGTLVEVPPKVEYCYSGKMTLLAFATPRWFSGNDTHTRWNPDVVGGDAACELDRETWATRFARMQIFGKSPVSVYLQFNQRVWNHLPPSLTALGLMRLYGNFLHALARAENVRGQAFSTFFLRNRPELELIRCLLQQKSRGEALRVAVLACSTGAEAYSVAWRIRSARPDLKLIMNAVDVSKQAVEFAKRGVYSLTATELTNTQVLERMSAAEIDEFFDRNGDTAALKPWIKAAIEWRVGDVGEPEVVGTLGPQDMVVANNFLCHMSDAEAEKCLRNIARLVRPGGYLFVSGVHLGVRTKVACDLGWTPVTELLEEIHEGDGCLRPNWPCHYGGLEPLDKKRKDWKIRYACAFQVGSGTPAVAVRDENVLAVASSGC
jgi:SAM-dependent methyltransferase